jgi:tRNA A-37 threonylcarbamoyl transferase component Bud32
MSDQQYPLPVPVSQPTVMNTSDSSSSVVALASTPPNITKDQLKEYLRQWVRVENEIGTLSAEIKKRKLIHQQLSASLLNVMRQNEIDCFDLANGRIVYSKTKTKAPLNNGQLKSALTTYYKDDASSRVEKTRESIKMKIPKNK